MAMVTKKQAASLLRISPKEVVRRIERGELVAKKKTTSKYSDWLVEVPDKEQEARAVAEVTEVLSTPKEENDKQEERRETEVKEKEQEKGDKETGQEVDSKMQEEEAVVELPKGKITEPVKLERPKIQPKKEDKTDARSKSEVNTRDKAADWWFGNRR